MSKLYCIDLVHKVGRKSYNFIDFYTFFDIIDTGTFIYPIYVSLGKTYEKNGERKSKNENIHAKKRRRH